MTNIMRQFIGSVNNRFNEAAESITGLEDATCEVTEEMAQGFEDTENAICEATSRMEEEFANIEDAICELTELIAS